MSSKSRTNIDEGNTSVVTYHHREAHGEPATHYISSVVINLRQLQNDLHAQHQHDKKALTELNHNFQQFVDHLQLLQSQNSQYRAAIADFQRKFASYSIDGQWDEGYLAIKRDISAIDNAKIDYEWDVELFHLQIAIYKQLIDIEQQWEGKRSFALEEELKQSASVLISLRTSYAELQRKVGSLYGECDDLFKQYLTLTHDWCIVKKQRHKWHLSLETLKSYIVFYKNLHAYVRQDFASMSIRSDDVIQFRTLDLDKIIKKIRYDFEVFYAAVYREMTALYEAKMVDIEADVKQALYYQSLEMEESTRLLRVQQIEYEKVQKSLSYEKEMLSKLEATCSKLEAEFKSIQLYHEERFEAQLKDQQYLQENIMFVAFDVEEIRRSKADLEAEIIVYRHLLAGIETDGRVAIIHHGQSGGSEIVGKLVVQNQKKGSIGIKECAPNGAYISLANYSTSKDVDISKWMLKRHIDSRTKLRYKIPDGVRLKRGNEVRIYTKSSASTAIESSSYQILVNNDLSSWGMGNTVETILFNKNGDEEASYSQLIRL